MTWMDHVDAQRTDLRELSEAHAARIDGRFAEARADRAELQHHMDAGLAAVREEMRLGFAGMREEMARLEARFERRMSDLIKWSFVFWVGAVAAVALLAGVLP